MSVNNTHLSSDEYMEAPQCPCCGEQDEITETHGEVMDTSYQRDMSCERRGCDATWTESYTIDTYTINEHGSLSRTVEVEVKGTVMLEVDVRMEDEDIYERVRSEMSEHMSDVHQLEIV